MKTLTNKARKIAPIVLVLLFIGCISASATPEGDKYSLYGKHIKFTIHYTYYNPAEKLYYKCLLENLDGFIDSLKQSGRLKRGMIHFEILVENWRDDERGVEMYRYKGGYYCWLNGLIWPIAQDFLTKIITYFASDNWESFCYEYRDMKPKRALQVFNRRIDTIAVTYRYSDKKLFELNSVAVYFENGSLVAKDSAREYGKIMKLLPFSAGSKDFVLTDGTLYAVENNTVINAVKLTEKDYAPGEFIADVSPRWVNFWCYATAYLSYSIEKNKFYRLYSTKY